MAVTVTRRTRARPRGRARSVPATARDVRANTSTRALIRSVYVAPRRYANASRRIGG